MPLLTDNIEEARVAYGALEKRTLSAERLVQSMQAALDQANAREPISFKSAQDVRQLALDREADNARLRAQLQQAIVVKADLPLQGFIASLGLAAAMGEATMPDRTISSMAATLQTHVLLAEAAIGIHFFQTGIDQDPASLSSTTFQLAKVTPQPGAVPPRNLYTVLQDKQGLYANTFWANFATATQPPSQPAAQLEAAIAMVLASAGNWSFAYLLQSAAAIGALEKDLSALVVNALKSDTAARFDAAVGAFLALTTSLSGNSLPVAGDLLALAASLDDVTRAAKALLP